MIDYIAGNTIYQQAILYSDIGSEQVFSIPDNAVVTAYVTDTKRNKIVIDSVQVYSNDTDNDWINGLISCRFDQTDTESLKSYDGKVLHVVFKVALNDDNIKFKQSIKAVKLV